MLWWIQGTRVDDTKNETRNEDRQFTLCVLMSRICVFHACMNEHMKHGSRGANYRPHDIYSRVAW